jgi:outer membrane protein assembly factor BamB
MAVGKGDADIIWRFDMRDELGVFPRNMTSSSVLVVGDRVYATTSNGRDWSNTHLPAPNAPALICLDKRTGKLLGREASGISKRTYTCNWSSPAYANVNGREMIIFGGGDGICYAFEAAPTKNEAGVDVLKEIWRFDCNPASHKAIDGKPLKYGNVKGPSEIIATPVVWKNRVYIAVGQDPEKGDGVGCLSCIDATKSGDITETGKIWQYEKIARTISTVSVVDGLLTAADFTGTVHCLDPETGTLYWTHDTEAHIWGSTLIADGKIYIGNENGDLTILAAAKEKKEIGKITLDGPVLSTPVPANGVLYVSTDKRLYAFEKK